MGLCDGEVWAIRANVEAGSTLGWNTRDGCEDLVAAGRIATSRRCYVSCCGIAMKEDRNSKKKFYFGRKWSAHSTRARRLACAWSRTPLLCTDEIVSSGAGIHGFRQDLQTYSPQARRSQQNKLAGASREPNTHLAPGLKTYLRFIV
jgi:hypothetical protein